MNVMAKGTVRLKGGHLKDNYPTTMYQMAKNGDVSYTAVHRYITKPEKVDRMDGGVLYAILTNLGMGVDEVLNLKIGDVFDLVEVDGDS